MKLLKLLFQNHVFFFEFLHDEAAAVVPNGPKTFFAKGIATLINGQANLLNNDSKNPPD